MRIAMVYDMDACRGPTGVTRHALAQLECLSRRPEIQLQLISGRITEPDGRAYWENQAEGLTRRELPLRTRNMLRFWRVIPFPPIDVWTGALDWVYSPAEYFMVSRRARIAVTSHAAQHDFRHGGARRRSMLTRVFSAANLVLSVSKFNTKRLLEAVPACAGKVAEVPNGADDHFFEPAAEPERNSIRRELGLKPDQPFLLSVANFQPHKNLERLVRATSRLTAMSSGDLALVLVGEGAEEHTRALHDVITASRARVITAGYRQGKPLRALYGEALALVFPSLGESFGIPAVEAMAQGCPVALANSTALPEIGGTAGWYFDPESEEALGATLGELLSRSEERDRRAALGRTIAEQYRWQSANDRLIEALKAHSS